VSLCCKATCPYAEQIHGTRVVAAGCVPILHMGDLERSKKLSDT